MIRTLFVVLLTIFLTSSAAAEEYPVLFVHGFCSNSNAWDAMFDNLARRRFGDELVRLYQGKDGRVYRRDPTSTAGLRSFTIDFYDPKNATFDSRKVADVPIVDKVGQLKAVIDAIKQAAGASKVIIVSHSMGGLVSRSYVQGWGLNFSGRSVTYANDVDRVVTIDTPHRGSFWAPRATDLTPWDPFCQPIASINKSEMLPDSSLLNTINYTRPWPIGTGLDAVVSYHLASLGHDTDDVVSRESQDIRTVSDYWSTHPSVRAHLQRFPAPAFSLLHGDVLRYSVTSSLVTSLVEESDRASVAPPPLPSPPITEPGVINLSGTWSGSWSSTDGQGTIVLNLTQSGPTISGSMTFLGTSMTEGAFTGTLTQTSPTSASLQWTITYSYPVGSRPCAGSFSGPGTGTATLIQGTYSGSDCRHQFSNGRLSVTRQAPIPTPPPTPGSPTKRYVISASALYLSALTAAGTDALIGATALANRTPVTVTDVATTPDGHTYAASFTNLYSIDTSTATLTPIGLNTLTAINALASDSAGNLWGASNRDGSVYLIDRENGSARLIGQFGSNWVSSGDLAFDASGTLWAAARRLGDRADALMTVNPATGTATFVGEIPGNMFGLVFVDRTLYGLSASTNSLYAIDTASGAVTLVRRLSFSPARVGLTRSAR